MKLQQHHQTKQKFQADQSMKEYYTDCEVFMKPNVEISVVVLQFSGLNLNGHTYNGDPYESQFKTTVAKIISAHCQSHAQECPGTMLPVEPVRNKQIAISFGLNLHFGITLYIVHYYINT